MGCPKLTYYLSAEPRLRCVYNAADGEEDCSVHDAQPSMTLRCGYTGHEHLPEFGLINMNARLYDPMIGRFLSPDPYVQAPDFTQSYNRYSYCLNNPLIFSDPDGKFFWSIVTFFLDLGQTVLETIYALDWRNDYKVGDAWKKFDPSAPWSKTNKAWEIDKGLFRSDPNLPPQERAREVVGRFFNPQTYIG